MEETGRLTAHMTEVKALTDIGGGGGGDWGGGTHHGGSGGSGVVIIRYPTELVSSYTCGGSTTTNGASTVCTFASSGTFTVSGSLFSRVSPADALLTRYTYDPLGRTITTANAVGTTTNTYRAWTTTTTDPNGEIKDSVLDAYNNLSQVVEHGTASNATTTYTYDAANNLTNITDALSNVRNFTYDGLGNRLTGQDLHASGDATFGTWLYSYDDAGNLASSTDPKGQNIVHAYDALNRPLTESWVGHGTQITNTYDSCTNGIGLLCSASSTAALDTNIYDVLGHTVGATTTIGGTGYGLRYSYDRQGNVTNVTNYANNTQLAYTYNTAGLVSAVNRTIASSTSLIASMFNYSPINQVGQVILGSGASTTYSYDSSALYRLTRILTLGAAPTTLAATTSPVSILVVGGGGAGGSNGGGGGGAGGYQYNSSYAVTVGSYSVVVGAGGTGATGLHGGNGSDSSFDAGAITATGGGGGGSYDNNTGTHAGQNGGSGGGAGQNTGGSSTGGTGSQGGNGGNRAGNTNYGAAGGGGAGANGQDGPLNAYHGGNGGNGIANSITGSPVTYGGGGGGSEGDNLHTGSVAQAEEVIR